MDDIRKCPFCGGDAVFIKIRNVSGTEAVAVTCTGSSEGCPMTRTKFFVGKDLAIEQWNRRAD